MSDQYHPTAAANVIALLETTLQSLQNEVGVAHSILSQAGVATNGWAGQGKRGEFTLSQRVAALVQLNQELRGTLQHLVNYAEAARDVISRSDGVLVPTRHDTILVDARALLSRYAPVVPLKSKD